MSILAMTSCCMQWPLSFQTTRKSFALHNNWNECSKILPLRLPLYGYVVVMIFIEINKKTIDHNAFRSSLTEFVVPKSIAKYAARSVFCSVALLFSRLVHCRHRVLELANNVTSHNNSWYATISLKNQRFEGKRRPQERPIERLSSALNARIWKPKHLGNLLKETLLNFQNYLGLLYCYYYSRIFSYSHRIKRPASSWSSST